jgi:hypothetical protein
VAAAVLLLARVARVVCVLPLVLQLLPVQPLLLLWVQVELPVKVMWDGAQKSMPRMEATLSSVQSHLPAVAQAA